MKVYTTQTTDSFADIAKKFHVKDEFHLKTFHNLHCPKDNILHGKIPVGTQVLIPDDPQYLIEDSLLKSDFIVKNEDQKDSFNGYDDQTEHLSGQEYLEENDQESVVAEGNKEKQKDSNSNDHNGKYFVIQKGICRCNQGFTFPKLKVTSHQKHYWNDAGNNSDYLAVTEDDLTLDPASMPFGNCKLKPISSGYLPCTYAPAGKWTKVYDKVKVMEKCCVTEISELMCTTGGKITIFKHGQQSEIGKGNINKADTTEQQVYNPLLDFEKFKEDINGDDPYEVI